METKSIPITQIDVSEFNVRKNLSDGQHDSSIEDLANSIQKQGLLNPITIHLKSNGRYGLIAGQRRLLAFQNIGRDEIPAIVRNNISESDATAISLVENFHRADMNPLDKAKAFNSLYSIIGDYQSVSKETGVGVQTIKKYIQLLDLSPDLQNQLAAGEVKNTDALARLSQKFEDEGKQIEVWNQIGGFTQDIQREIIKRTDDDLGNLEDLIDQVQEGVFNVQVVKNCPFDCSTIPDELKEKVYEMIKGFHPSANGGAE